MYTPTNASTSRQGDTFTFFFNLVAAAFSLFLLNACSHSYGFSNSSSSATSAAAGTIAISPFLPAATVGSAYDASVKVTGGTPPYSFSLSSGQLPEKLTLNSRDGDISGMPIRAGSFAFALSVSDSKGLSKKQSLQIVVAADPVVAITVTPVSVKLLSGSTSQFIAQVVNSSNTAVTWAASLGSISSSGLYTAPSLGMAKSATVTATSQADPTKSAEATVAITPPPPVVAITLTPVSATLSSGSTRQFNAQVTNSSNTAVNWAASQGTISSGGLYTAPSVSIVTSATVTATSVADPTKSASATITVNPPPPVVAITLTPLSVTVPSGATSQFTAQISNSSNTAVNWAASQGSISSGGLYTAPSVSIVTSATVTATSVADPTKSASATITVNPPPPVVAITLTPLSVTVPSGATSQFTAQISNSSNTAVNWAASQGSISADGLYTAPQVTATAAATVTATSAADPTKSASASVSIMPPFDPDDPDCGVGNVPLGATVDGPATLPERCVNSSLANTPAPGSVVTVAAGGDLQAAYNALSCGQILLLAHGATWDGPFTFTAKNCDDRHWIWIMSDGALPAPGYRVNSTYLPQLAAISLKPGAPPNLVVGDHLRLTGIAWLKEPGGPITDMVVTAKGSKVIFDRNYAHGNPGEETRRFISLTDGSYIGVVESLADEIHCIAVTGSCTDAQAIGGGGDTFESGPFKIVNNSLSASGQSILFGGGAATATPCDIEIRSNYLYKPMSWNPLDPSFLGTKYIVKNLFELKNGCRVLFEGNVLANVWGGFTQRGTAILIGPKNQQGEDGSLCPLCLVSNVVLRYDYITMAAAAIDVFDGVNAIGGWADGGHNDSIHDIIADNLQYGECYECGGSLGSVTSGYLSDDPPPNADVLKNVLINHVTLVTVPTWPANSKKVSAMMLMAGPPADNPTGTPQMSNITYENSLFPGGHDGFYPTGGGANNCSFKQKTLSDMIKECWTGSSLFSGNLVVNYGGDSVWPSGNLFSNSWSAVGFTNYNNGDGGDYQLTNDSPYKGQALDGSDPGASVNLVQQYIQNSIVGAPGGSNPTVAVSIP